MGGNQVENNATLWSNLQDCKISSQVEIPKLDPSVAIIEILIFPKSKEKGLLKNVQDGISRPLKSREIQETKVATVLRDTLCFPK